MIIGVQARIHGRVQGVGFRAFVRHVAHDRGVKGWVRNLPDGAVEMLAEADRSVLESFIDRVQHGNPLAKVRGIELIWLESSGQEEFVILR